MTLHLSRPTWPHRSGATALTPGQRVPVVHRVGALVVAAVIAVFGVLGLLDIFLLRKYACKGPEGTEA